MKKIYILLGHMTFLDPVLDGEHKAIIHTIQEVKAFDTLNDAEEYGEEALNSKCESYLIPQAYNGVITI